MKKLHNTQKANSLINWVLRNLMGLLKEQKITLDQCKITPEKLAALMELLEANTINNRTAQEVFLK